MAGGGSSKAGLILLFRCWFWIILLPHVLFFLGAEQVAGECRFPAKWNGVWFQSGLQHLLKIQGGQMSFKGRCIDSEGDKYLLEDKLDRCHRCIVIHQRHENVLQYKETFSDTSETLYSLCSRINGDAQLYSMFRVNASPVTCPFRGPFTFMYNRGYGECRTPISSIDSCSEDFRIRLRYQACADIPGTESTVEELFCLATWREGSMRYLVGKLEHNMATSDEDKYRCFVYDRFKDGSGYMVAQSGDATCNGLFSAAEGSKTMRLLKATSPMPRCHFPPWLTHGHHWHTLDGRRTFTFGHRNNSFRLVDQAGAVADTHVLCMDEMHNHDKRLIVVSAYITIGCTSGYMCFSFTRRWDHVTEVQRGTIAKSLKEACESHHFDRFTADYTTLVTSVPDRKRCPYVGQYVIPGSLFKHRLKRRDGGCDTHSTVKVGCDSGDTIEFRHECTTQHHVQAFHCHGNWEENGTSYLITTQKGTKSKYCFIYAESDNVVKFSSVRDSCPRNIQPGIGGFWAFNFTASSDQCHPRDEEEAAATSQSPPPAHQHTLHVIGWLVFSLFTLDAYWR